MSDTPPPSDLLYRWEMARRQGQSLAPEELCRDCPERLDDLRRQIELLELLRPVLAADATATPPDPLPDPTHTHAPGAAAGPAAAAVPDVAGRYEFLGEVGGGGMGLVLRARDRTLNRDVAVKILRPQFARRPDIVGRFLDEAQIAGQLQHPGVVPVHELGALPDGRPFIAMKLVKGRTLDELLRERPAPAHDLPRWLGVFEQVCQALAYAHARGVVHRDLKPANVMVGAFGEVQVMDWGLAKVLGAGPAGPAPVAAEATVVPASVIETGRGSDPRLATEYGSALGTYAYMAPEQARGELERLDRRCDVFGLGAVLCEILTGQPPYTGPAFIDVRRQALSGDLSGATARLGACGADAELVALAKACLAPEPEGRPADAGAVAAAVSAHLAGVQTRLRQAELDRARAEAKAVEERKRRRVQMALAAAGLGMVVLAVGAWRWVEWTRAAYAAEAATRASQALGRAESLRDQARAVAPDGAAPRREATRLWEGALAAADEAEAALRGGPAEAGAARAVAERLPSLRAEAAEATRDLEMLSRLEAARDLRGDIRDDDFDRFGPRATLVFGHAAADGYAAAFRDYGIDVAALEPAEAARRVRRRPIRDRLVAALDDWLALESDRPAVAQRLLAVSRAADPDPFRDRLRTAVAAQDAAALKALAESARVAELPVSAVLLLADGLQQSGAAAAAVPLLEQAQRLRPNDFWVNDILGVLLSQTDPTRVGEAARYYAAALAVRPDSFIVYDNLGTALAAEAKLDEAVEAIRKGIGLAPQVLKPRLTLSDALAGQGRLDEAVAECREVIRRKPDFAYGHFYLAKHLHAKGDLAAAEAACRESLRLKPTLPNAHAQLGLILAGRGAAGEAVTALRTAARTFPHSAEVHNALGTALGQTGANAEAAEAYRAAVRLRPNDLTGLFGLGLTLSLTGDPEGAVAALRRAVRLSPNAAVYRAAIGYELNRQGAPHEALAAFQEAVRLDPRSASAHNGMGIVLDKLGRRPAAVAAYRKAIELKPGMAVYHWNLGVTLTGMGAHGEAVAAFRESIRLAPANPEYRQGLGRALENAGQTVPALLAYGEAIALRPADPGGWNVLGNALWRKDALYPAAIAYGEAIRRKPDEAPYHDHLGNTYRQMGRYDDAAAEHREAFRLKPDEPKYVGNLGTDLRMKGATDEALAAYREALRLKPDYAWANNEIGLAQSRAGRLDEAVAAFRQALLFLPKDAVIHDNLGQVYFRRRRLDEAAAAFRKAVELDPHFAAAYGRLGAALRNAGHFAEAADAFRRANELNGRGATPAPEAVRCERLAALERKLDAIAAGSARPADAAEQVEFALLCYYKGRYPAAARHFPAAAAARPALARDYEFLFPAACAAARAAAEAADDAERARLRRQALDWLRASLAVLFRPDGGAPRAAARQEAADWGFHPALAGLRDPAALANLPAAERAEWARFWDDVAAAGR
jgi:serine/threonine-protein kinase